MSYATLLVEREGPVGWLVFNRPETGNAMDAVMLDELEAAWGELDQDPDVRVIVNTGAGRAFQTGLDVVQLAREPDALRKQSGRTRRAELKHDGLAQRSLEARHRRGERGVRRGWTAFRGRRRHRDRRLRRHVPRPPRVGGPGHRLRGHRTGARRMPFEAVMRMALVGRHERMSAERALALGMVSQVVDPPERLREEAQALAEKIARNSPAAMAATKRALWGALEAGLTDACRAGARELVSMWGHPDQDEGPLAFAEKREPQWAGAGARPVRTR